MGATNVHTQTLSSGSLTISSSDNVVRVSVICRSGTVTALGSTSFQGTASSPVEFTTGEGITLTAPSITQPIDGFTISAASGVAELVISTQ
ncbi:MAG: hypothetical protein FJY17_00160 [Bacteroidetes bacterium]|nr:hypothetical protein [Bacteroidota bacterium]